jgi:hypothetical protein
MNRVGENHDDGCGDDHCRGIGIGPHTRTYTAIDNDEQLRIIESQQQEDRGESPQQQHEHDDSNPTTRRAAIGPPDRSVHNNSTIYSFSTVLVDPPRSGLDATTRRLVCNYDHIIYISCNPEALRRDLETVNNVLHDSIVLLCTLSCTSICCDVVHPFVVNSGWGISPAILHVLLCLCRFFHCIIF